MQEFTKEEEQEKYEIISTEHAKQILWKESLQIEKEQYDQSMKEALKKVQKQQEEDERQKLQQMKATRDLALAKDEAKRKNVVQDMVNDVSAGSTSLHPVVRTLTEFLGNSMSFLKKRILMFFLSFLQYFEAGAFQ